MRLRLFFTALVLFALSFGIYYLAQWLASDGLNVASRQVIPAFAALLATGLIWVIWNAELKISLGNTTATNQMEKQKRDRLDSVLRDLSDDDLLRLKQRLSDGTIRTEHLESQLIDSDSDLLYRGQG